MIKPQVEITNKEQSNAQSQSKDMHGDIGLLFLSNFVHQVVNPMNGVIGTLSNISDGTYDQAIEKQKINACRAQLEQCVSLIRNLAFLSDYFSDAQDKTLRQPTKDSLSSTSILPQVIIEAIQFFQSAGEKKGIHIELTDSVKQYRIKARPELLKQVFINLLDNWLKYGLPGQTVTITPSVNSAGELVIINSAKSIGFDGSDAENIFRLGYRASQAKQIVAQGSGIGLHICKQIMENALNGGIRAEHNNKNNTTTFRVTIPGERWEI